MSALLKSRPPARPSGGPKPAIEPVRNDADGRNANPVKVKRKRVNGHLVSLLEPESPAAERYRGLRYVIEQMKPKDQATTVGVCSSVPGEGKSITAINLAGALAQAPDARVLLVEVDVRRPSFTVEDYLSLGMIKGPGLVDATQDTSLRLKDLVRRITEFNLNVLPAGRRPNAPYEVLKSPRFGELIEEARKQYDYVILDAPPVVPVPDCRLISEWVDGFLVVVTAHKTPRPMLEECLNLLTPKSVLGLLFNGDDSPVSRKYGYYGYGYNTLDASKRDRWWKRKSRR